ncbi:UDP-N-acetylmuramoyl-L-alanyl-D-glutamate--2,6-diaminopimelate ligase [Streptomyces sp. P01-B04]|uniref:UDP-N-acetylmuramoyl-L-alanyl-D-glutamate--2, 6-diaminopimelate ligase n=1 Tax=Streptomyces poriferorum TaxID=2798799 RepID=UPI001C5CDBA8|nr:UDP-N-acetylmuramoyl-L-alanyl-D-glutamate--2,6-diaminopimelate ligase [Streptomyces poriferorum]MBW5249611.1 UDP-N-acetylmuramoyl-L-alanyl-D-glutamate--2,6-diaminopimelate ligase [Streptomyces poriferorum]MBW5258113.1 UDP-N-acetylmuramoyl-L-alanyl-D-glutamate--2,6-diaminopimelate ligase [Streptomyces poriferorum]
MNLRELLAGHDHEVLLGDPETPITAGARFDAHRVTPGSLYIAVPGHLEGGPEAVGPALARGAVAVLLDSGAPEILAAVHASGTGACVVRVADTRTAAAVVTSRYFGEPGRAMNMVAVTGTNGKTSVSYMVESLLRIAEGAKVGVIGTAGSRIGDALIPMPRSVLSTPESPDFQYLLGRMRDQEVSTVVLEATSMGLLHHRVDHAFLDVGIFTNLTQDHLDDHGTMEHYRDAKLRLFQGMCRSAVVNVDDPVGAAIVPTMPGRVTTYGIDAPADFRATDLRMDAFGTSFTLHHEGSKYPAAIPVPGRFSVSNALASLAACHLLGHDLAGLVAALDRMPPVPGRLERFETPRGTAVIVDYAHSPDSLDKVLSAVRDFATGRVITVFGCGGDRDVTKRARMGEIAGARSDLCVLTSDNPRNEDPEAIMDQIAPGLRATGTRFERHADRRAAIAHALSVAGPDDIVLVAGKGSEPYQIVGDQLIPFSDMATVRELAAVQD